MTLQEYLDRENITIYEFAKKYSLPQRQVYKYATGQAIPRPNIMNIITYATKGKVKANDFYEMKPHLGLIKFNAHLHKNSEKKK